MALSQSTLQNNLQAAFDKMKTMTSGGDKVFADEVSQAVADYFNAGSVSTTYVGTVPSGVIVTASGTGNPNVQASVMSAIIMPVLNKSMTNIVLATALATGIMTMCMTPMTIQCTVVGTAQPPGTSPPVPIGGTSQGQALGIVIVPTAILAIFNSMNGMKSGGDQYLAQQLATLIHSSIMGSAIQTAGTGSIAGAVGTGSIS